MFQINERGFDFAVAPLFYMAPSYGRMGLARNTNTREIDPVAGEELYITKQVELETVQCGLDNFNYSDTSEILMKGITNYTCIKNKSDMIIGGTFFTNFF
jgi:hypothetical protein